MFPDSDKRYYCPDELYSSKQIVAADILKGQGFRSRQSKVCLRSDYKNISQINQSIRKFVRGLDEVFMDSFVAENLKPEQRLPDGKFSVTELETRYGLLPKAEGSRFVCDSPFGFFLGFQKTNQKDKTFLAGVAFAAGKNECPLIVQLQTVKSTREFGAVEILQKIRWEHLLVEFVLEWAYQEGFMAVYLQPAAQNRYVLKHSYPIERAKLRYDVTAKRLGFRQDSSGLYAAYFSYAE